MCYGVRHGRVVVISSSDFSFNRSPSVTSSRNAPRSPFMSILLPSHSRSSERTIRLSHFTAPDQGIMIEYGVSKVRSQGDRPVFVAIIEKVPVVSRYLERSLRHPLKCVV